LSNHPINLLDCTLRDGGYYNDWDFDRELVVRYLEVMERVKIDMIEIGFRFSCKDGFLGVASRMILFPRGAILCGVHANC